jgi:hypothetical protein
VRRVHTIIVLVERNLVRIVVNYRVC